MFDDEENALLGRYCSMAHSLHFLFITKNSRPTRTVQNDKTHTIF